MKNNELSPSERLDVAIQSHKFYSHQCIELEKQIDTKIDSIFQTEEAGKNISKKDITETVGLVDKLLTLSSRFMKEGRGVLNELEEYDTKEPMNFDESAMEVMKMQLTSLNEKQVGLHTRVEEIRQMLVEMYNLNEDDTF